MEEPVERVAIGRDNNGDESSATSKNFIASGENITFLRDCGKKKHPRSAEGNALEKFKAIVKVDDARFTLVDDIDVTGGVYNIYKYENYVDSQADSQAGSQS